MRYFLGFVVFVPLAVVFGVFAVENRTLVRLHLWPFPGVYETWASVWVLGLLAAGILAGLAIGWLSGSRWRRRARRAERQLRDLERRADERDRRDTPPARSGGEALSSAPAAQSRARRIARFGD